MAINVTVTGNPIKMSRRKMILSDLENMKKTEREQRKRLRQEQVLEQSKALGKKLLERTRQAEQDVLNRLEHDCNTEMRKAKERRLLEAQRRYQDIENIGYAQENAAKQPNVECIKQVVEQRNNATAKARGEDAMHRLQESNKVISSHTKQIERLHKARCVEKERSAMVANLPKKTCVEKNNSVESSENEIPIEHKKTPVRKKFKTKESPHVSVRVNSKHMEVFESDDNEPRKTVPNSVSRTDNLLHSSNQTENGHNNNSSDLSSTSTTSSSSISDDSSYFSDNAAKVTTIKKHQTSPSKVSLYDYKTRQRCSYDRPPDLVEKVNIKNKPNAKELAEEITETLNKKSIKPRECSNQRTHDAILREKIRRDYKEFEKKLHQLAIEERKLKARQIAENNSQTLPIPSKKNQDNAMRQKTMDRVFESLLRSSQDVITNERPITITPRDYIHSNPTPNTEWKEPPHINERESDSCTDDNGYCNRNINIFEMLKRIEKLKRSLLQEVGAELPDDVFNASVKSLFSQSLPNSTRRDRNEHQLPKATPVPEIEVINMSGCEEINKPLPKTVRNSRVSKKANSKNVPKTLVGKHSNTKDQEIQVELCENQLRESNPHPLEPTIKIITPESEDSTCTTCSNSSAATDLVIGVSNKEITVVSKDKETNSKNSKKCSSDLLVKSMRANCCENLNSNGPFKISFEQKGGSGVVQVRGLIIDADKKEIIVLPTKNKSTETVKQAVSTKSKKCQSLPGSKTNSPVKKLPKSAPTSQRCSPRKPLVHPVKSTEAKFIEKRTMVIEEQKFKSQSTQVSIDSSTASSQINSISDDGTGKLFNKLYTSVNNQVVNRFQDSSDTSTTYKSPPSAIGGILINTINSSTSILEMLDSSANETIKRKASQVSPVSSPETPSPRTMMLPSNIPKPNRICKQLKFQSMVNNQMNAKPQNTSTFRTNAVVKCKASSTRPSARTQKCTCRNPECKLIHDRLESIRSHTSTHAAPETLNRLQNACSERIASLTDLIQQVRNEQKGLEFSIVANEDTNSAAQAIVNSELSRSSNASKLVKTVEAVHTQLKKTLLESQKIISGEGIELPKIPVISNKTEKSPSISFDFTKDTSTSESFDAAEEAKCTAVVQTSEVPAQPKIIQDERVNLRLNRFRTSQTQSTCVELAADQKTTTSLRRSPTLATDGRDESQSLVEILSDEILEQSKSLNKSAPANSLKDSDNSLLKSSQAHVKDLGESSKHTESLGDNSQSGNLEVSISDFVPLLAGIPKISRSLTKGAANGRGRPPVTLISGPYRPEIVSPVHELSTIIEFDTPETVNKSQFSTKSPSTKSRKKLLISETIQSAASTSSKQSDAKLPKNKPSVHVAPLPAHQSPRHSLNLSGKSVLKSTEKSPRKSLEKPRESVESKKASNNESRKCTSTDSLHTLIGMHIEQLHHSQDNTDGNYELRISQISSLHSLSLQSLPDENIEQMIISEMCEESKSKSMTPDEKQSVEQLDQEDDKCQLVSTSSASISGLSGVSEITTTPSSDLNLLKCPSSPEEMELTLKKLGLGWAIQTLKKTREASALGSSSSSDVTPVNTGTRHVSPVKKQQDGTNQDLLEISDVSSISIKHVNKSTERSVLVKGRTSTPNRLLNTNSDGTVSTLGSFSSELNIVVQNQSADITMPNISFSNKL